MTTSFGPQSAIWDQMLEEITAGRAFSRGHRINANAGQTGEIQLWNPAGSGTTVQIINMRVGSLDAQQLTVFHRTAAATTLLGDGHNLLTGVDVSAAELRYSVSTSLLGNDLGTFDSGAAEQLIVWEKWGPNVSPGEGYSITAVANGARYFAWFDWIETPL